MTDEVINNLWQYSKDNNFYLLSRRITIHDLPVPVLRNKCTDEQRNLNNNQKIVMRKQLLVTE